MGHYENSEVVLSPEEVKLKHGIFVEHCEGCVIKIEGKFKSLQMNNCNNVSLVVHSCISGVEVMNGENVKVYVRGHTPSVSIDKCEKVRVVLN